MVESAEVEEFDLDLLERGEDEELPQEDIPVPAPRRSLRHRAQPVRFRSDNWIGNQSNVSSNVLSNVSSNVSSTPEWMQKAQFLLDIACKYSHLPDAVLLEVISMVRSS